MAKASKESISLIPVDELQRDEDQPRTEITDQSVQELADSIKETGKLLYPILYREVSDEDEKAIKIIVDGERRWRAYQKLGWKEIPAIKFDGNYEAVALIGNIVREDLTAMQEALAVEKLRTKSEGKHTLMQLGSMLGKAESTMSEILKVAKLPEFIRNEAINNKEWSRTKLLEIAKKRNGTNAQRVLFERLKKTIKLTKSSRDRADKVDTAKKDIEFLKSKLSKIETDVKWTSDDKKALKQLLKELNDVITKLL